MYIEGNVNPNTGMVLDFKQLIPIKEFISCFDHATVFWSKEDPVIINFFKKNFKRVLVMKKNTTAENMAKLILKFTQEWLDINNFFCKAYQVDVWETETGCAIANDFDEMDILIGNF